jgi:hypothetical protein
MSTRGSDRYWNNYDDYGRLRPGLSGKRAAAGNLMTKEDYRRFFDQAEIKFLADAIRRKPLSDFEPISEDDMTFNPNADGVFTNADAAKYLNLAPTYLHNMRHHKTGPAFTKLNGRIYYKRADLDAWNAARKSKAKARKDAAREKASRKTPKQKKAA